MGSYTPEGPEISGKGPVSGLISGIDIAALGLSKLGALGLSKLGALGLSKLGALGLSKLGAAPETAGGITELEVAGTIDISDPDGRDVVVNNGTEYVVPDAPDAPDILSLLI